MGVLKACTGLTEKKHCVCAHLLLCLSQEVRRHKGDVPTSNAAAGGGIQVVRIDAGEEHKVGDSLRVGSSIGDVQQSPCRKGRGLGRVCSTGRGGERSEEEADLINKVN